MKTAVDRILKCTGFTLVIVATWFVLVQLIYGDWLTLALAVLMWLCAAKGLWIMVVDVDEDANCAGREGVLHPIHHFPPREN